MRTALSIVINFFATVGWVWTAWNIFTAHMEQVPLTVTETVVTIISCLFIAFMLVVNVIEGLVE